MQWLLPLLTIVVAEPAAAERALTLSPSIGLRFSSGAEWDTNSRRAIEGGSGLFSETVSPDALARFLVDVDAGLEITPRDRLHLEYALGAKRFAREATEDLLIQDLTARTSHELLDWVVVMAWARGRASRIRSGARDYTLGAAGATLSFYFGDFGLHTKGRASTFDFPPSERLDYDGPGLGAELVWAITPELSISAFADHDLRAYQSNALVKVIGPSGKPMLSPGGAELYTFCDGSDDVPAELCSALRRDDKLSALGFRAELRGSIVVGIEGTVRLQRSTSAFESLDRYQLSASGSFPLPLGLVLSLIGSLQYNRGVSVSQSQFLAEDDENQNRLETQLAYKLSEVLSIDLRYALYANEFASNEARFLRQIVYSGLTVELGR